MTNSTDTLWKLSASQIIKLLEKKDISSEEVLNSNINRIVGLPKSNISQVSGA